MLSESFSYSPLPCCDRDGVKIGQRILLVWNHPSDAEEKRSTLPKIPRLKVTKREVSVSIQKSFVNNRCKTSEPWKEKMSFQFPFWRMISNVFYFSLIRLLTISFFKKEEQSNIFCKGWLISIHVRIVCLFKNILIVE